MKDECKENCECETHSYKPTVKLINFLTDKDRILDKVCDKVVEITEEIEHIILDMRATMHYHNGVAIAAPQIGKSLQIIVVNAVVFDSEEDIVLINPELEILNTEQVVDMEFCLSFDIGNYISRYKEVQIKYLNLSMQNIILHGDTPIKSRILQHEINHLNGITLISKRNK